jgi:hypothetical protein
MWMISGPVEKEAVAYLKDATLAFTWKDWRKPQILKIYEWCICNMLQNKVYSKWFLMEEKYVLY